MLDRRRQQRVDREGSRFYHISVPAIPPGGTYALETADIDADALRYYPLDFVHITNESAQRLILQLTPSQIFTLPSGVIMEISDVPITQFRLKNIHTTFEVAAGDITLLFRRLPLTEDKAVRRRI